MMLDETLGKCLW